MIKASNLINSKASFHLLWLKPITSKEGAVLSLMSLVHFLLHHTAVTLNAFKIVKNKLREES